MTPEDGNHEIYAVGPPDRPFNVPNWGAFDATANLYLTDSGGWGDATGLIWRIRPGGAAEVWSEVAVDFPNGCAVAPDGRACTTSKVSLVASAGSTSVPAVPPANEPYCASSG